MSRRPRIVISSPHIYWFGVVEMNSIHTDMALSEALGFLSHYGLSTVDT